MALISFYNFYNHYFRFVLWLVKIRSADFTWFVLYSNDAQFPGIVNMHFKRIYMQILYFCIFIILKVVRQNMVKELYCTIKKMCLLDGPILFASITDIKSVNYVKFFIIILMITFQYPYKLSISLNSIKCFCIHVEKKRWKGVWCGAL